MRKDTLYITLSRDITSYTITSGQRAIATNVNYAVTIESPTLTTNLAGRDVSVIISDTEGNTLTTATTFYPDTKNPYKAVTGSLLLDGTVYAKFFDGKPVDTAVRLPIVIRDKSATLLSSDIVVMNGGENAEPSSSDETVAGLVNAIRFYDLAEFKAWLAGDKTRDDWLRPTDIVVGQWVHTQQDGSFICKELIGAEPSVAKNFMAIATQFPLTGTLKMNPDNGVGLSVYSGDVYNEAEATSYSIDAITYKGEAFTFNAGDNQIARQKDNYALENRVNSTMKSTLDAIKADNDETHAAMLPVMNTTVEARNRAETAARGAKASETRAITAETNAATSEQNAEASKKSATASESNAWLYRQQALAYSQKAETEAATATTKATEASTSASEASASAGDALAHKNDAGGYAEAARLSAEASSASANSSATSAAASKSSADTAAQSESIAVSSAAAAASSANTASEHKDAALASASNAATSATNSAASATSAATSSTSASNFASAASDSAKAAATSAADLAEAVATAESLDGRIGAIEGGYGFYKIKRSDVVSKSRPNSNDVDKVLFFDKAGSGESDTTSTLAVINRALFANKVSPAQQFLEGGGSVAVASCYDYARNKCYICLSTTPGTTQIAYVYEANIYDYSNAFTFKCKVSSPHSSGSGYSNSFTNALFGSAYCVHDGFVFYVHRHYRNGPWLSIHDVETGTLVSRLDLDPVGSGTYLGCGVWFNPSTGHICAYSSAHSLSTGEAWGNGFIRVFNWDSETKTLADIPKGDSPVTMVDFRQALIDAGSTDTNYGLGYLNKWEIRDEVFLAGKTAKMADMVLFRVTEDDGIEPCYEWDVEYDADEKGVTRPVWETQEEAWTDAEGNTKTIQNYVRNSKWDFSILPKMTKGRMMKFMRTADYDGVPSGTWSANPVFSQSAYSYYYSSEASLGEGVSNNRPHPTAILLTDGVVRWILLGGHKFVRQEAFNTSIHLDKATRGTDGKFVLKDVRKGAARIFSGWRPTANQYIASAGAQTSGGTDAYNTNITLLVSLTAAQSGTALSRLGMVKNAGVDNAAMTPMPFIGVYNADNWVFPALPYSTFGFFGRLWATTYDKTYGGAI